MFFLHRLQDKVIDIEVANETPSPTVDPSVHVILIGHSMGGIVGAEALLLLASEQVLPPPSALDSDLSSSKSSNADGKKPAETNTFMFPHIQGLLAFDTPFLGIAPGVVSYTAENHYKTASAAYGAISEVAGVFGWGSNKNTSNAKPDSSGGKKSAPLALPPANSPPSSLADAAATPSWQRWGRYAMFAGAAGAVAAGGAAALYTQRDRFSAGWNWATSHLEFVGCLARPEELRRRLAAVANLQKERGIGFADFYICLGRGAIAVPTDTDRAPSSLSQHILRSKTRTFCNLPEDVGGDCDEISGMRWIKTVNEKATDETKAHMTIFSPNDNPTLSKMAHEARNLLVEWVDKGWYSAASSRHGSGFETGGTEPHKESGNHAPKGFMDADDVVVVD